LDTRSQRCAYHFIFAHWGLFVVASNQAPQKVIVIHGTRQQ